MEVSEILQIATLQGEARVGAASLSSEKVPKDVTQTIYKRDTLDILEWNCSEFLARCELEVKVLCIWLLQRCLRFPYL